VKATNPVSLLFAGLFWAMTFTLPHGGTAGNDHLNARTTRDDDIGNLMSSFRDINVLSVSVLLFFERAYGVGL